MKLSFNRATQQFQVTELGKLIDSDTDFEALAVRQGFVSDEEDEDFDPWQEAEYLESTTTKTTDLF